MTEAFEARLSSRGDTLWLVLAGELRAAGRARLEALFAKLRSGQGRHVIADLSGVEVADFLGLAGLRTELSRFERATVLLPPSWTQAAAIAGPRLAGLQVVETPAELAWLEPRAEQRRHPRVASRWAARLRLDGREVVAVTRSVSKGGVWLELADSTTVTDAQLESLAGGTLLLSVVPLGLVEVRARVARVSSSPRGLAVELDEPQALAANAR